MSEEILVEDKAVAIGQQPKPQVIDPGIPSPANAKEQTRKVLAEAKAYLEAKVKELPDPNGILSIAGAHSTLGHMALVLQTELSQVV